MPAKIRDRIFAISSVSGSSVGAVMAVAAIRAANDNPGDPEMRKQPCISKSYELWHGVDPDPNKTVSKWRECFETLMSGDFLTPVFTGLMFRDLFRFLPWDGRSVMLEKSWEQHFAAMIEQRATAGPCIRSLICPFMSLKPESGKNWTPLLVLNGTSVSTGQRIITTSLDAQYPPKRETPCIVPGENNRCVLFQNAFLFHYLIDGSGSSPDIWQRLMREIGIALSKLNPGKEKLEKNNDVSLSTAAHNSARFPIISPPGEIRDHTENIVDRIVDGGYYENFGAETAAELAVAIKQVEPQLDPFILVLSNDPSIPQPGSYVTPPDASDKSFLTDVMGPIGAIEQARQAHGNTAVAHIRSTIAETGVSKTCSGAHIRVWPVKVQDDKRIEMRNKKNKDDKNKDQKIRELSMSWWLSKPVQIYLSEQTELGEAMDSPDHPTNRQAMKDLLAALNSKKPCDDTEEQPQSKSPFKTTSPLKPAAR